MARGEIFFYQPTALHTAVEDAADASSIPTNKFLDWSLKIRNGFLDDLDEERHHGNSTNILIGDRPLGRNLLAQYPDYPRIRLSLYLPDDRQASLVAEGERTRGGVSRIINGAAALGVEVYRLQQAQPDIFPFSHLMNGITVGSQRLVLLV